MNKDTSTKNIQQRQSLRPKRRKNAKRIEAKLRNAKTVDHNAQINSESDCYAREKPSGLDNR